MAGKFLRIPFWFFSLKTKTITKLWFEISCLYLQFNILKKNSSKIILTKDYNFFKDAERP